MPADPAKRAVKCFVSVQTAPGRYEQFEVPEAVYVYIRQLEICCLVPEVSRLPQAYPRRFSESRRQYLLECTRGRSVPPLDSEREIVQEIDWRTPEEDSHASKPS